MNNAMNRSFRADVEGLRAIAVLPILLFHIKPELSPGGFVGVDIFFVISGFVITRMILAQKDDFRLIDFYIRRFFRLFPALLVTIALTLAAAWRISTPEAYVDLAKSGLASIAAVSNIYFYFSTDYFTGSAISYPLLHTWSLGVEEQFYFVWPALLLLFWKSQRCLVAAILILGFFSFVSMVLYRPIDSNLTFYMMPFRIFEFSAGAVLAAYGNLEKHSFERLKAGAGLVGACLILASVLGLTGSEAWPNIWSLAPVTGTMLLIAAGPRSISAAVLSTSLLRWIGRLSYALYLAHWPVICLYRTHIVDDPTPIDLVAMAILSFGMAAALHYGVERPIRMRSEEIASNVHTLFLRWRLRLVGISALTLSTITFAALIIGTSGFPSRVKGYPYAADALTFAGDKCSPKRAVCAFGDPTSNEVVYLLGDSHALNLIFGLDELFKAQGLKGIAFYDHGCLFLHGTTRFIKEVKDTNCMQNIRDAFARLTWNTRPVIYAGSYNGYRNSIGPADSPVPLKFDSEDKYFEWLTKQLANSIARLRPDKRQIILFLQTYDTERNIAQCLRKPGHSKNTCTPASPAQARLSSQKSDRALQSVYDKFPGLTVIDPKKAFCDKEKCTAVHNSQLLFRDRMHLTHEGSRFLIRRVTPSLKKVLKTNLAVRPRPSH